MTSFSQAGFIEISTGDPAYTNLWGPPVNTNFAKIDNNINGLVSLGVGGSSNVVLTFTNGATDQATNTDFTFTGVLTGNIQVLWPAGKTYKFTATNNTTGAFSLNLGANNGAGSAAGAVVPLTQGSTVLCKTDGTNVFLLIAQPSSGSPLPVSEGGFGGSSPGLMGVPNWAVAGGSSDAITAIYTPSETSLVDGVYLAFRATAANTTTSPTFQPNGLAPQVITKIGGQALVPGDIPGALAEILLRYNLANTRWELINTTAPGEGLLYYTPEQFGAVGNGVADDSGAINTALAYIQNTAGTKPGGILWLGPKTYYCASTLTPYSATTMMGCGGYQGQNAAVTGLIGTIILGNTNVDVIVPYQLSSAASCGLAIKNLTIKPVGTAAGIRFRGDGVTDPGLVSQILVDNVAVHGGSNAAAFGNAVGNLGSSCYQIRIQNCFFSQQVGPTVYINSTGIDDITFEGNHFFGGAVQAVLITGGGAADTFRFLSNRFEQFTGSGQYAFDSQIDVQNLQFNHNWIWNCSGSGSYGARFNGYNQNVVGNQCGDTTNGFFFSNVNNSFIANNSFGTSAVSGTVYYLNISAAAFDNTFSANSVQTGSYTMAVNFNGVNLMYIDGPLGHQVPIRYITASDSFHYYDDTIAANAATGGVNVTLPAITNIAENQGIKFTLIKTDPSGNPVGFGGNGSTINGQSTYTWTTQYQTVTVRSVQGVWIAD